MLRLRIDQNDFARLVHQHDRVRGGLKQMTEFPFGSSEFAIHRLHFGWARNLQRLRDKADQKNRGRNRGRGGYYLHKTGKPVIGLPERPDFHHVRHPAGNDEDAKTDKHPVERKILPAPDEADQGEWDGEICGRDQEIRDGVQSDQIGIPKVAVAVRHEAVIAEEPAKQFHYSPMGGEHPTKMRRPSGWFCSDSAASPPRTQRAATEDQAAKWMVL